MKRITILLILLAAGGLLLVGGLGTSGESSNLETAVVKVGGMSSWMCELGVRGVLTGVEGVEDVSVDRERGQAIVSFNPGKGSPRRFVKAVRALGYRASLEEGPSQEQVASALGHSCDNPASCDNPDSCDRPTKATSLTKEQITAVTSYVADRLIASESMPSSQEIKEATGVNVTSQDVPMLQQVVVAALSEDPRGQKLLQGSRCSRFEACSFSRILSTADGEQLEMYTREKAQDGRTYSDFRLPEFEARDLSNKPVRSRDLLGQPTILVFLAQHCNHSVESLPILTELAQSFGPKGYKVVAVFVNSGTAQEVKYWVSFHQPGYERQYDVWVVEDISVGDVVGSHLTPTYFIVDAEGQVQKKLVGFKTRGEVFTELSTVKFRREEEKPNV